MRSARTLRGVVLTIALLVGGTPLAGCGAGQGTDIAADDVQRLRQENDSLEKQFELATSNAFYLVIDPSAARLTLAYRGTTLRQFPILEAEVGVPRVAFVDWGVRRDYVGIIWSGGRLDPQRPSDRVEFKVSGAGSPNEPPAAPEPPEIAIPVPATYLLRYEPGLVIEVDRAGDSSNAGWRRVLNRWRARGRNVLAALSPSERKLIHLRMVLTTADADSLYRSLPPDTRLLIVAPGASRDGTVATPAGTPGPRRAS
jgi:hypothetical protein